MWKNYFNEEIAGKLIEFGNQQIETRNVKFENI